MFAEVIESVRLRLVPLDAEVLRSLVTGDVRGAEKRGGFRVPEGLLVRRSSLERRILQLEEDPQLLPWLTRGIVLREGNLLCGRIGFHSRPGPPDLADIAADGVEIGYEVDQRFRRRGYAKEACQALIAWAMQRHDQRCFVLSISPSNVASLALARSLGFEAIAERVDPEDGLELCYCRRFTTPPRSAPAQ